MDNTDIERLYDAFTELCDYVEMKTEYGCTDCPNHHICFGLAGHLFAESLQRIRKEIGIE